MESFNLQMWKILDDWKKQGSEIQNHNKYFVNTGPSKLACMNEVLRKIATCLTLMHTIL